MIEWDVQPYVLKNGYALTNDEDIQILKKLLTQKPHRSVDYLVVQGNVGFENAWEHLCRVLLRYSPFLCRQSEVVYLQSWNLDGRQGRYSDSGQHAATASAAPPLLW